MVDDNARRRPGLPGRPVGGSGRCVDREDPRPRGQPHRRIRAAARAGPSPPSCSRRSTRRPSMRTCSTAASPATPPPARWRVSTGRWATIRTRPSSSSAAMTACAASRRRRWSATSAPSWTGCPRGTSRCCCPAWWRPPTWATSMRTAFAAVFERLSHRPGLLYDPFFLQGVATHEDLEQGRPHPPQRGRRAPHRGAADAPGARTDRRGPSQVSQRARHR